MARDPATDTTALVKAAARVFSEKGYRNATIDDIALAAGISRPTVYKYTKSKQYLLDLMVEDVTSSLGSHEQEVLDTAAPPCTRLRRLLRLHVETACANRVFYRIVLHEEPELSPKARKQFRLWARSVTKDLESLLEECLREQDRAPGLDSAIASNLILSMTTSLYTWYDPKGPVDIDALFEQLLMLIGSVTPDPDHLAGAGAP
jgi:AcrR family transcriptional regulator